MEFVAKWLAVGARWVASVSSKLSIAAVLGVAVIAMLPHTASTTPATVPTAAIEVLRAKPVPLTAVPLDETPKELEAAQPPDATFQLAARRTRRERAPEPEPEESTKPPANTISGISQPEPPPPSEPAPRETRAKTPVPKTSAISPAEPPPAPTAKAPITPSQTPPEAAQAEPPKPDVWSDTEVIAALRECVRLLAPLGAEVEVSQPVKSEQCGAPAAVLLRRIGSGANKVELNPPAMINCAMVASLHTWVEKTLQPAAQASFGSPVARLRSASGYSCRNRNGSRNHSDKLSEHALANAIDIAGFVTADGRSIEVARHWGPTLRDERNAIARAQEAHKATIAAKEPVKPAEAIKAREPTRPSNISAISDATPAASRPGSREMTASLRLGRSTSDVSADPNAKAVPSMAAAAPPEDARKSTEGVFLRQLHKGACGVFGTVLGPEANEAHRDHFHFDLAHRRSKAFCE